MKYTLIFIFSGNKVLLLNRKYSPAMGTWCGVGGHIEPGETSEECAVRELEEETGIQNVKLSFSHSAEEIQSDVYYGYAPSEFACEPRNTQEGILSWLEIKWALNGENEGVNTLTWTALKLALFSFKRKTYERRI